MLNSGQIAAILNAVGEPTADDLATLIEELVNLRLTEARADALDNLANLDAAVSGVGIKAVTARSPLHLPGPPTSLSDTGALQRMRDESTTPRVSTALTTGFQTVLDLAGPGEVNLLVAGADETTWAGDGFWRITIDGVVWVDGVSMIFDDLNGASRLAALIGYVDYDAASSLLSVAYEPVPFKTSFKVEVKRSAEGSATGYTFFSYTLR